MVKLLRFLNLIIATLSVPVTDFLIMSQNLCFFSHIFYFCHRFLFSVTDFMFLSPTFGSCPAQNSYKKYFPNRILSGRSLELKVYVCSVSCGQPADTVHGWFPSKDEYQQNSD